jgi:hypothetical protein
LLGAGSARVQVDLRWETGAQFVGEWRDYKVTGAEFANGPAFQVDTDGTLTAGGQTLATLPAGQWVHLQMSAKLGAQADGTFAITLRLPEGKVIERPDLAYGSAFKRFDWLGFVSTKDGAGVFYLDNLSVEPVATAPR